MNISAVQPADTRLSLADAARSFPRLRNGRPVHPATVLRWVLTGVRGPYGARIRLAATRIGGRWVVSQSSIDEFNAAMAARPNAEIEAPPPRTPDKRERAAALASAEMQAAGY